MDLGKFKNKYMHQIDGNKIIAKFMGMEITNVDVFDDTLWVRTDLHNGRFEETNACFHFSWDWLMPVVGKIVSLKGAENYMMAGRLRNSLPYAEIEMTWNSVVEFIK